MVMEKVRLRLVFSDPQILRKSQKKQGLRKCWILIKPKLYKTISHLSDYLLRIFHLQHSSPHGLILSMDDFVLPPFESTSILKDEDIICVRRKVGKPTETIELSNGVNALEQPARRGVKLLAIEEFQKETGGYQSQSEEDEHDKFLDVIELEDTPDVDRACKKRKASKKLQGSKRKKSKLAAAEERAVALEDLDNDVLRESLVNKDNMPGELEKLRTPEIDEINECMLNAKRFGELQENGKGSADVYSTPDGTKKFPSRSARRKKAKRRWLREQAKSEKIEHQKQLPTKGSQQPPDKDDKKLSDEYQQPDPKSPKSCGQDNKNLSEEHQQPGPNSDADEDVVPVVIRPGHIRFTPLRKVDAVQAIQQNQTPVETFQWKGVTSKKKGQKWGKEKAASSKWNNYEIFNQDYSETLTTGEEISVNDSKDLDFNKLKPYTSLPKEGDVIAYRLIELSSSWSPEPTSFRVGNISWYNLESNKVMLLPVPEYPLTFEKKIDEDASALQSDTSLYEEDGSLQIDYSLLVDVRIIMHRAKSVTGGVNEVHMASEDAVTNLRDHNNNEKVLAPVQENGKFRVGDQDAVRSLGDNNSQKAHAPIPGNGKLNAWEEINQALFAKKAELSHVDDQCIKEGSGSSRWSYKALRSSALGPTMAFLRAQSGI
ncbi:coilin isoform X2 [Pistacia vera]|uniref:coilin isoform X2 n=1 Tax=Pistacia vera TaxID=55513 RepID=UPI001263B019|nr:coilin isoform X2 [Pistacia vera]